MAWTTLTFASLEVLSSTKMSQLQANLTAIVQSLSGSPTCSGASIIPSSAVVGLTIDQNNDAISFVIDTESTSQAGQTINAKYGLNITQDISGGYGTWIARDIAEAGSNPLVTLVEDNTSSTQNVLSIQNDGSGSAIYIVNNGTDFALDIISNYIGAQNYIARFFHDGNDTNAAGLWIQTGPDDGTAAIVNRHITFADGDGGSWGYIQTVSSNTTYNASSDKRFKKNIKDTKYCLNDLLELKVIDYNFEKKEGKISDVRTGLAAQDVFEIYPEAVAKPNDESKEMWGIDYGRFTPLLIKATQDQQKIIENLELRIKKLEEK